MKACFRNSIHLFVATLLLNLSCTENPQQSRSDFRQTMAIHELIVLRTEGLALTELVDRTTLASSTDSLVGLISDYYVQTHPEFLKLCRGQPVLLENEDFDTIWKTLKHHINTSDATVEEALIFLYTANINKSISVYQRIIQENQHQNLHCFALRALPILLHHQKQAFVLLKNKGNNQSKTEGTIPVKLTHHSLR